MLPVHDLDRIPILDQLPDGVWTSTTSRRSAGKSGVMMWLICLVAFPAPRTSTMTSSGPIRTGAEAVSRPDTGDEASATVGSTLGAATVNVLAESL